VKTLFLALAHVLLLSGFSFTQMTSAPKPVLMAMTSHAKLSDTGKTTGFYLGELTHPLEVFEKAGLPVELASIKGGEPPVDGLELEDAVNARYWNDEAFREKLSQTKKLPDLDPSNYAAVQRFVRELFEAGSPVGAVCHGPAALVNVKLSDGTYLVAGKEVSSFTNSEEEKVGLTKVVPFLLATKFEERGAKHLPVPDRPRRTANCRSPSWPNAPVASAQRFSPSRSPCFLPRCSCLLSSSPSSRTSICRWWSVCFCLQSAQPDFLFGLSDCRCLRLTKIDGDRIARVTLWCC